MLWSRSSAFLEINCRIFHAFSWTRVYLPNFEFSQPLRKLSKLMTKFLKTTVIQLDSRVGFESSFRIPKGQSRSRPKKARLHNTDYSDGFQIMNFYVIFLQTCYKNSACVLIKYFPPTFSQ